MVSPRQKRWVVREGDGQTVAEIVVRAGESDAAVSEGRVFVGRTRVASASQRVRVGDEVRIGAQASPGGVGASASAAGGRAPASAAGGRGPEPWALLWQRDGLVACAKPAGMPTVPDHVGASHALVSLAAAAVGTTVGGMFVTSRLDREVSGAVVFATTLEAEARLRTAREEGRYARRYVAVATSGGTLRDVEEIERTAGVGRTPRTWNAPIGQGRDPRHRAAFGPAAKLARTHWDVIARAAGFALLAVEPQTGRTHQIRIQAAHAGAPLLGDRDYGGLGRTTLPNGEVIALSRIALHAARVTVPAANGEPLTAVAPISAELERVWTALGGAPEAWDMAVSCVLGP